MAVNEWQGLRDDVTVVSGEGMLAAQNCSYRVKGESRRRPGLGEKLELPGDPELISEFQDRLGQSFIVIRAYTQLYAYALSTAAVATLASSLTSAYRGSMTKSQTRLYFTNDFDPMKVVERGDIPCNDAGIAAPTTGIGTHTIGAPVVTTGVCTAGNHLVRYRYYSSKSLYPSNPSVARSLALTGSAITFSIGTGTGSETIIRSTDPKVDQIIVEMTAAGASAYYRAALVNQTLTGTTINMADASLILQDATATFGDFGHEPPPLGSIVTEHRGRLWVWGTVVATVESVQVTQSSTTVTGFIPDSFSSKWAGRLMTVGTGTDTYRIASVATGSNTITLSTAYTGGTTVNTITVTASAPDTLYWSRAGYPESFKPSDWARRVLQNQTDIPSGMISQHNALILCGQRTIRVLDYSLDPASGQINQIPSEMGVWNQRCLVEAGGKIYGWGRTGVWSLDGLLPQHLSRPIDTTVEADYDPAYSELFHGVYDPRERVLMWFYVSSGDVRPKSAICYDLDRQLWSTRTFRQEIISSTLVAGTTNTVRVLLGDYNFYGWYLTADRFDGVPLSMVSSGGAYTGVLTVAETGATVSSVKVSQSMPTGSSDFGPNNLDGCVAYNPTTGETSLVYGNTADTLELDGSFSTAPTLGTEIYIGSFEWKMRTKWAEGQGMQTKKRPSYLMVRKVPGTNVGKLKVRIYEDFSTTPMTFTLDPNDTFPDGVSWTNGATYASVDLDGGSGDGIAFVPLSANWKRVISAEVSSVRPDDELKLLEFGFLSESRRSEVEEGGE